MRAVGAERAGLDGGPPESREARPRHDLSAPRVGYAVRRGAPLAARGFTLIEVLVALSIMAVLAIMAWQGIDNMARTRSATTESVDRTLRLNASLAQWERDLQAMQDSQIVPPLQFDGAHLRLTRAQDSGMQLVVWSLRQGALWRWASLPVSRSDELEEQWLRSQQLLGNEPGTLRVLSDVASWQVYFFRDNSWTNAQSAAAGAAPVPPPGGAASGARAAGNPLPSGVRVLLGLKAGTLTRDITLHPQ